MIILVLVMGLFLTFTGREKFVMILEQCAHIDEVTIIANCSVHVQRYYITGIRYVNQCC